MAAGLRHMSDKSIFHSRAMLTIETNDQIIFQIKWEYSLRMNELGKWDSRRRL